ncbi:MAG: WD40 repeat domain-containing protein [Chlamydiota bacterium]
MKLTHSINAHRGSVRCILKHENFLFTAGEFGEIKKWNLETKELLFETEALDQRTICTLHIHQNTLFTGNNRGDLVMRHVNNLSFNKHLSTGNGTGTIDKILTYNQQLFFCSLDDESINIQNLETEKSVFCEKLQDMGHLMNIMVHPGELAVWGNHQKLAFFNINDHPKHPTQVIKTASNYCYDGKILITSNLDGYKKLVKVFVKYQED